MYSFCVFSINAAHAFVFQIGIIKNICAGSAQALCIANLALERRRSRYSVGNQVEVQARTRAVGSNAAGGVGLVTNVTWDGDSEMYTVKYVVGGRTELNVRVEFVSPYVLSQSARAADGDIRSHRYSAASAAARDTSALSEKRRHDAEVCALRFKVIDLEAQLSSERARVKRERAALKDSAKRCAELEAKVTVESQRRIAEHEQTQRAMIELLEEVAKSSAADATATWQAKFRLEQERQAELKREHLQLMKSLEGDVIEAQASHHRLEAAVGGMLADVREQTALELASTIRSVERRLKAAEEARVQSDLEVDRVRAELQAEHKKEIEKAEAGIRSVMGIARVLLPPGDYAQVLGMESTNFGARVESLADMGQRRKRDLGKVAGMLVGGILDLFTSGEGDKVLAAITERRDASKTTAGRALQAQSTLGNPTQVEVALKVIADAYRNAMVSGDKNTARQLLSVAVSFPGVTDQEIIELFTDERPLLGSLAEGDEVDVTILKKGNHGDVECHVIFVDLAAETVEVTGLGEVAFSRVWNRGAVRCTQHQVHAAKLHAKDNFPGAQVSPTINPHQGIDKPRADFVANFLRDDTVVEEVEGSFVNAKSGLKYRLKQCRFSLWQRLAAEMIDAQLQPCSWTYFWSLTRTNEYELLTVDNCCCGICRELGFENYNELTEIVQLLEEGLRCASNDHFGFPKKREMEKRIEREGQFRRGTFARHLQEQNECGSHCLRLNLTTHCDPRFRKLCTHGEPQGDEPESMVDYFRRVFKRNTRPGDWNDTCEICGGDESGNAETCSHCNVVAHPKCIKKAHWDLPLQKDKDGEWTCWHCVCDLDSRRHVMNCSQCNEAGYIIADIKMANDLLRKLELKAEAAKVGTKGGSKRSKFAAVPPPISGTKVARLSEVIEVRLQRAEAKQHEYHAHLIQDRNQGYFKDLAIETLPLDSFFGLVDYWAKLTPGKAGGRATCEGDSAGLSAHGTMFVYRNPTLAERGEIDKQYGDVDWSLFGPAADEEGAPSLLEEHFNTYCDDSRQGSFHTKSVLEATISLFLVGRPWLAAKRKARLQSDNATNYRDPTTEIDLIWIGTRCFSTSGMGKGETDGNGKGNKADLISANNARRGYESAHEVMGILNEKRRLGQTHVELALQRANEDGGNKKRQSVNRHFGLWTVDDEYIRSWEYLDPEASRESLLTTGRARGYGWGVETPKRSFNTSQRTQTKTSTGASLIHDDVAPNPKQRGTKAEKKQLKVARDEASEAKRAAREEKAAALREEKDQAKAHDVEQCPRCGQRFMTRGWFNRHRDGWCADREDRRRAYLMERDVKTKLKAADVLARQEYARRLDELDKVKVELCGPRSVGEARVGIELKKRERDGLFIVAAVSGLAELTGRISEGFVAVSYGDGASSSPVASASAFPEELLPGETLVITFARPTPPVPYHGAARAGIHMKPRFKMHEAQLAWLERCVFNGRKLSNAAPAWAAMKLEFDGILRIDPPSPMWLEKKQIATWLAGKLKAEKATRRAASAQARKVPTPAGPSAKGKRKTPAAKRPGRKSAEKSRGRATVDSDSGTSDEKEEEESEAESSSISGGDDSSADEDESGGNRSIESGSDGE